MHNETYYASYLHETCIITRDDELSVRTDITAARNILETRDCLCHFLGSGSINLYTRRCCYSIPMRFRRRELDRSDRRVFLDEHRVFELTPIS